MAREWFIEQSPNRIDHAELAWENRPPRCGPSVHVIEKSAYEQLEAELKEVKEENIMLRVGSGHYRSERDIHIKEGEQFVIDATSKIKEQAERIIQLKTEIERVKDTPGGKRIYAAFNEIQKRDELIQKCEAILDRYSHLALPERDPRLTDRYSSMPMREFAKEAVDEIKKWKKENGRS